MHIARIAFLVICVFMLSISPPTDAKAAKDAQDPKVNAARREAVQVRAVVSDRTGRIIDNLASDDFILTENGVPQIPITFSIERLDGKPGSQPRLLSQSNPVNPGSAVSPRIVVLMVDTAHISPNGVASVRMALNRFVGEQTKEQDVIAVMTTTGKPGIKGEFLTDRTRLKAEIGKLRHGSARFESFLTPSLCSRVIKRDPQAVGLASLILNSEERTSGSMQMPNPTNPEAEAVSKCQMLLLETASRRKSVTSSIDAAVQRMVGMPGQPLIALFSEGFSMIASGGDVAIADVRPAISRAARSGVMVYSFDVNVPMSAKQANIDSYALAGEIVSSKRDLEHGMSLLASETGGGAFHNLDGLSEQLQQMLDENRLCYRLAYYPPSGGDPRNYRSISVTVKGHPEYRVRALRGYDMMGVR
jgi:VWFA-related protein